MLLALEAILGERQQPMTARWIRTVMEGCIYLLMNKKSG